jgi:hypothetical protein
VIYAVRCDLTGLVKLGYATSAKAVSSRLQTYATASPGRVELLWSRAGTRDHEHDMHGLLVRQHYRAEWFRASPDEAIKAANHPSLGSLFYSFEGAGRHLGITSHILWARFDAGELPAAFVIEGVNRKSFIPREWVHGRTALDIWQRRQVDGETAEEIRRRYASGERSTTIARSTGFSQAAVLRCVRLAGLTRSLTGANSPNAKLTDERVRAIRAGLEAGASQASLAREYGVSERTVHNIMHAKTWRHIG